MNVIELRLGNLILDRGIVTDLKPSQLNNILLGYVDYEPVIISEEYLIKLGFFKGKDDYLGSGFVFRKNNVSIYQNDDNLFSLYNYNERRVYLKYVHQLQNLYFALTGENLIF